MDAPYHGKLEDLMPYRAEHEAERQAPCENPSRALAWPTQEEGTAIEFHGALRSTCESMKELIDSFRQHMDMLSRWLETLKDDE